MTRVADRLAAAGIALPTVTAPIANYLPVVIDDGVALVSGQLPRRDGAIVTGRVGDGVDVDAARDAARLCGVAILAVLAHALDGDLDRVRRCLSLHGFVNAAPGFQDHPLVINGASDLMVEVFGDAGRHARAAIGCSSLPMGAVVEVSASFAVHM